MTSLRLVAFILTCVACQAQSPVAGRWRSLATSSGGIGAIFEFHADGTLDFSPGAVVESTYRVEGKELVSPPATVGGPEIRQTMEWVGNSTLRLRAGANPATELTRQGARKDAANAIIGEWTSPREMNGQQFTTRWFFYPAGKGLFLLPFTTLHGHYSTSGESMRIELPGRGEVAGPFSLNADVLSLPGPSGESERYARF